MRHPRLLSALVLAAAFAFAPDAAAQSAKQREREKEALSDAREQLRHRQEQPRQSAAATCLAFDSERSIEVLIDVLNEDNPHTRDIVWDVLPQFKNPEARKRVERELRQNKKNADVRQWCAELLGLYGDASLAPALEKALADKEIGVQRAAARSLGRLKHGPAAAKLEPFAKTAGKEGADIYLRANAIEALARIDAAKYEPLYEQGLADPDGGVRCALLGALPAIYPDRAEAASAAALEDRDWRSRLQAVENLGAIRSKGAVDALVRAAGDERPAVRERANTALRKLTGEKWTLRAQWEGWWTPNREAFEFPDPEKKKKDGEAAAKPDEPKAAAAETADPKKYASYNGITVQSDHVAFLIDKSEDMEQTLKIGSRVKADVALEELDATLAKLEPGLLFNVFTYAAEPTPYRKQPIELDDASRKAALAFVKKTEHEGKKNIWLALTTVVEDPTLDTLFLLSSGEPEIGRYVHWNRVTEHLKELNRFHKVVIHTVAYSDSQWNRDQLQKISEATGGQFVYKE